MYKAKFIRIWQLLMLTRKLIWVLREDLSYLSYSLGCLYHSMPLISAR